MTRLEDQATARQSARATALGVLLGVRSTGTPGWRVLDEAADTMARYTAVHLADSKGNDLALVWAREHAKVYRELRDSSTRALTRVKLARATS